MATIDIFPLAINGVSPPLNLLYKLFSNPLDINNLLYPLDLTSNPNYGHAINFEIVEKNYNIQNIAGPVLTGRTPFNPGIIPELGVPNNWKIQPADRSLGNISLYMPDTLQTTFSNDWQQISLTEALGIGSYVSSAISDYLKMGGRNASDYNQGNFRNIWGKAVATGAAGALAGIIPGGSKEFAGVVGTALNQVPNPQLQMYYKGVGLREFQFDFKFTPVSQKEARAVEQIIKKFTYYSLPRLLGSNSHQFLEPPQIFNISFAFTGGNELSTVVTNFFKNIGTNILTSQISGSLFGSTQASLKAGNARIFKIYHPCALKEVTVDYAPNGWAAFGDGYPVETTMSLTFVETDIVTKNDVDPNQAQIDNFAEFMKYDVREFQDSLARNPEGAGDY